MAIEHNITADCARQMFHYDPDTGRIRRKLKGGAIAKRFADAQLRSGYRYVLVNKRKIAAHRLAWLLYYGEWPTNLLDHINRIKLDNRIVNLRKATTAENAQNANVRNDNTSGHRGVCWHKRTKTWQVRIRKSGAHIFIGHFSDLSDAVAARNSAEKTHHTFR